MFRSVLTAGPRARTRKMKAERLLLALATGVAGLGAAAAGVLVGAGVVAGAASPASAAVLPHPSLVPDTPATGYPVISQAAGAAVPYVGAADQVGRYLVAGGNFLQVTLQDGTIEPQPYLAVFNVDTKQLACPNVTVNGEVTAVEPGPTADTVYVGGKFTSITGPDGVARTRVRLARLFLPDCSVDLGFAPPGPGTAPTDLALTGNRLFVAGSFTAMGTTPRNYLAEVNATTGALNPAFSFPLTRIGSQVAIQGMGVNPAGTRLVVGGNLTGSFTRVFDITDPNAPVMTAHSSSGYPITSTGKVTDAGVSADGSLIGLTFAAGTSNDYVSLTPTAEQPVTPRWSHAMRDSSFSVAVSNNAMYVGGHFCNIASGPGPTELMAVWPGTPSTCTGTDPKVTPGVWRSHLAALSLTDGTPLTWNPGNASNHGATSLTVTTRGLLVGFDGSRMHSIRTGPLAFLDLGPQVEDSTPPSDVTFTAPAAGATLDNPATVSGAATDNLAVGSFQLTVRAANGKYLSTTGGLVTAPVTFTALAKDNAFTLPLAVKVASTYTVTATAVDVTGLRSANPATLTFVDTAKDTQAPAATVSSSPTLVLGAGGAVTGAASDNVNVASLAVRATDAGGQFLQADGSLAATPADLPLTTLPAVLPAKAVTWSAAVAAAAPAGAYAVTVTAMDATGNATTVTGSFTVLERTTNFARTPGAVASQSSVLAGNGGAGLFVDGSTDGVYTNGSVAHTDVTATPWMQLDLGASRTLSLVRLWNRTDCCADRILSSNVYLSATPFTSTDPATTQAQAGVVTVPVTSTAARIDLPVTGGFRYVRLQSTLANQALNLAEIEAIGPETAVANLALARPATASSGAGNAGLAVDGSTGTGWTSSIANNQSWQVDLGAPATVETVDVTWGSTYATSYQVQTSLDGVTFSTVSTQSGAPGLRRIALPPTQARYLRIQGGTRSSFFSGITLTEVAAYGRP